MSMHEIESVVEQSVQCLDKSNLSLHEKRDCIYALYKFQSLFDTSHTCFRVKEILYKYHYLFRLPIGLHPREEELKSRIETEGRKSFWMEDGSLVQLEENEWKSEAVFYCEAGSAIWEKLVEMAILKADDALPIDNIHILDLVNRILLLAKEQNKLGIVCEWYAMLFYVVNPELDYYNLSKEDLPKLEEIRENIFSNDAIYPHIGDTDLIANGLEYLMEYEHEYVQFMLNPYIQWLGDNK